MNSYTVSQYGFGACKGSLTIKGVLALASQEGSHLIIFLSALSSSFLPPFFLFFFLSLFKISILFIYFCPCHAECGILAPRPEIDQGSNPSALQWKRSVLTGLPGKSPSLSLSVSLSFFSSLFLSFPSFLPFFLSFFLFLSFSLSF